MKTTPLSDLQKLQAEVQRLEMATRGRALEMEIKYPVKKASR